MKKKLFRLALCAGVLSAAVTSHAFAADYTTSLAGTVSYDEATARYAAAYTQGLGGKEYTLLVVKDTQDGDGYAYSITSDSILYIDQGTADLSGAVSFAFPLTPAQDCVVLLGGEFSDGESPKVLGTLSAQDSGSTEGGEGGSSSGGSEGGEGGSSSGGSEGGQGGSSSGGSEGGQGGSSGGSEGGQGGSSGGSEGGEGGSSSGGSEGSEGGSSSGGTSGEEGSAAKRFLDVDGHWAEPFIQFVTDRGIFGGTSATTFSPDVGMTRGMLVTVLHNMNGANYSGTMDAFSDVAPGDWFAPGANWAANHGIVSGVGGGKFAPNSPVTREQTALILYGYAKMMGLDVSGRDSLTGFQDAGQVSSWAEHGVAWAVDSGLISGKPGGLLDPKGTTTRAEMSAIMYKFAAYSQG